jgi:membrane protein implicated in regulation of membrane protease activity
MSTVPASSNIILGSLMVAFFSLCLVITFQAPPIWWVIPAAFAIVVAVLATIRIRRARRMRRALHGAVL